MSNVEYDPDGEEPPLLAFLREYWRKQRGGRAMPGRRDISPRDMKVHLSSILLADVVDGGLDFRYRLVGSQLQRYFKGDPTGKLMSEALIPFGADTVARTIQIHASAVARRAPLRVRGSGLLYSQKAKQFDALLTPLSDDGVSVNMILGTFVFVWDFATPRLDPAAVEPDEVALARALCGGK